MKELFEAITTEFRTTNDLNTALSGQMYPHAAVQSPTFPYGIYSLVSDQNDLWFTDEQEDINIQFSLYSEKESATEITNLYNYLKDLFDNTLVSVSGWRTLTFKRTNAVLLRDIEMGTWSYNVDYDILLERERQ